MTSQNITIHYIQLHVRILKQDLFKLEHSLERFWAAAFSVTGAQSVTAKKSASFCLT